MELESKFKLEKRQIEDDTEMQIQSLKRENENKLRDRKLEL